MIDVQVDAAEALRSAKRVKEWPRTFTLEVLRELVTKLTLAVELQAKLNIKRPGGDRKYAPVFRGNLLASIQSAVLRHADATDLVKGVVYSELDYAPVVEYGRRSGRMPPPDALIPWVVQKFGGGYQGARTRGIAFVIARKIGDEGLPAHRFAARAAASVQKKAGLMAARIVSKWVSRVGGR